MKKFFIILLILLTTFAAVFAEDPTPEPFKPENATAAFRTTAPAFATRANRTEYGLFVNPAALRGGKFQILVGADADIYKAAEILSTLDTKNFSVSSFVGSYLNELDYGKSKLLSAEADLFLGLGNFAFGVYANADVDASVGGTSTFVNPVIDGGVALGYGSRVFNSDLVSVDVGLAFHADATFVNSFQMGTANLENLDLDPASILKQGIPFIGVSADAGVNVGFLKDHLVASVSFTDYAPFGCWAFNLDTKKILTAEELAGAYPDNTVAEDYKKAYKLNAGVSGNINLLGFNATAFADVVDILGLDFKNFEAKSVLSHVNVGATLDFAGFLKASAALYGGDPELGVGFDIFGNEVGLIYKISEGSSEMGQKTVDSLSVRVRLGFDTN